MMVRYLDTVLYIGQGARTLVLQNGIPCYYLGIFSCRPLKRGNTTYNFVNEKIIFIDQLVFPLIPRSLLIPIIQIFS
jgi:hypothetical protein